MFDSSIYCEEDSGIFVHCRLQFLILLSIEKTFLLRLYKDSNCNRTERNIKAVTTINQDWTFTAVCEKSVE